MELIYRIAIIFSTVICCNFINDRFKKYFTIESKILRDLIIGVIYSVIIIIGTILQFIDGMVFIFDGRMGIITIVTIVSGPIAGLVVVAVSIIAKSLQGGVDSWFVFFSALFPYVLSILFQRILKSKKSKTIYSLLYFAAAYIFLGFSFLASLIFTNGEIIRQFILENPVVMLIIYPFALFSLGFIYTREKKMVSENENLKMYGMAFDNSSWGITILNGSQIQYCNRAFAEMHDYSIDDLISKPLTKVIPEDYYVDTLKAIKVSDETGHITIESYSQKKDGTTFPTQVNVSSIKNRKGKIQFRIIYAIDITDKIMLKQQMHQSEKLSSIGQLAGGIAHDFNNQLVGIIGYSEIMKSMITDNKLDKYLDNILLCAQRSSDLTKQLLTFSKKIPRRVKSVDVNKLLKEVINIASRSIDRKITIVSNLKDKECLVNGDSSRLQNLFLNLVLNSRDAMSENGGTLSISSRWVARSEEILEEGLDVIVGGVYLEVIVEDEGIGIPQELITKIFEPFYTTKKDGRGTGMGLSTVSNTIDAHGGFIEVDSQVGVGTMFKVFLPSKNSSVDELVEQCEDESLFFNDINVLVVDDEPLLRDVVETLLIEKGCRVVSCANGHDAINEFKMNPDRFDIVLLDMVMPVLNGFNSFIEMRKIKPDIRVILTSGLGNNPEVAEALKQGAITFLQKPFKPNDLFRAINSAMVRKYSNDRENIGYKK